MELESNLNEISTSWTSNLTRKKLAFIGTGVLVATAICISVIVAVSVKSSSSKAPLALSVHKEKMNLIKDEIKWVSYSSEDYSLTDALAGGTGANGKTVYLCRAKQRANKKNEDEVIPGTFDPTDSVCKVPYGDKANAHSEFELLVTKNPTRLVWVEDKHGELKKGAISGGHTAYNEELYVTRFKYYGFTVLGKLHLAHNKASGPVDGLERYDAYYDLLCLSDYAL
uniref:Uncharacterized protein n=1 Tax=Tetranychus urticae TaxID=32264 RepID=T1KCU6_TETUR